MFKKILGAACVSAMFAGVGTTVASAETFVTIGTGGQTGVYYQVGGAICRLVNKGSKDHDIKCTHTTGGSVANINGLRNGDINMGVAQSDWQYHAYNGTAPDKFPDGEYKDLRAVFSVHPEPFTVVARADSGIDSFEDLKGKRVNLGNPGSGARATFEVVMDKMGWESSDFSLAAELKSSEQAAALCDDKIDAIVFTVGHPSGTIKEATTSCESKLINVDNDTIKKLADDNDFYAMATIKGGTYRGTDDDVTTFGVGATFVTSTDSSDEVVYEMVKAVFDNFRRFKKMHPAFANLEEKNMIKNNLSAPLHPGAIKYYKEQGWL